VAGIEDRVVASLAFENRSACLALVVTLAISAIAATYGVNSINTSEQSYRLAKSRALQSDSLTRKHLEDLAFLSTNEASFKRSVAIGKIGIVEEMDWLEPLLKISTEINAREFRYRIGDTVPVSNLRGKSVQFSRVNQIDIELAFELNHGVEVFQFFSDLFAQAPGNFEIGELEITRLVGRHNEPGSVPRIAAQVAASDVKSQINLPWSGAGVDSGLAGGYQLAEQHANHLGVRVEAIVRWFVILPAT